MDNDSNNFKPDSFSNAGPASSISTTTSPLQNSNDITGILKVEKVGPVFRIVDPHAKKLVDAINRKTKTEVEEDIEAKRRRGDLFVDDVEPIWHKIVNPMTTPPIVAQNLWHQFEELPIFGAPENPAALPDKENQLLREYVGLDLDDAEWAGLEKYCSLDALKTGKELKMGTRVPVPGLISKNMVKDDNDVDEVETSDDEEEPGQDTEQELCITKKFKQRQKREAHKTYLKSLKYRGVKLLPLQDDSSYSKSQPPDLVPGKDTLYRIRVYRPFGTPCVGEKQLRGRHSVFNYDIVTVGRQLLTALRDRFPCRNDVDMRVDVSACPEHALQAPPKSLVASGFLFINNVFYVDGRAGCRDTARGVRVWAAARGLGAFPTRCMDRLTLDDVLVKMAHPDVYVHQGNCEHLFLFSEIRLLTRRDPLHLSAYPCHTTIAQNQSIYCTTCAEFGAKWLVSGTTRVPFSPAFFCEFCFKHYLYTDNKKIEDFKAYPYRGNDLNMSCEPGGNVKYVMNYI